MRIALQAGHGRFPRRKRNGTDFRLPLRQNFGEDDSGWPGWAVETVDVAAAWPALACCCVGSFNTRGVSRMDAPLFPIRPACSDMPLGVLVLEPYREDGTWLFDDLTTGLQREPFVGEVNRMLDRLSAAIPDSQCGFRLLFSAQPFEGQQATFSWVRADAIEGNWYRADETGEEGWLCPALFCYFPVAPAKLFLRAEPKVAKRPEPGSG
jgi:hypothetical protein